MSIIEEITESGDNIEEESEEYLNQFIQLENASSKSAKALSIADLYMKHLSQGQVRNEFIDEFTDEVGDGKIQSAKIPAAMSASPHPSTAGYTPYSGIGKARDKKQYYETNFDSDDDTPDIDAVAQVLDEVADRVDIVYDCVKSTDQIINDVYEKTLSTDDSVNEIVSQLQHMTLRDVETCARIVQIEKTQRILVDKYQELNAKIDGLTQLILRVLNG